MGGGERMNDREVMESLLEGKVIVDESTWIVNYYKLIGDRMYIRLSDHMWGSMNYMPRLDSDCVRIEEEE